MSAEKFQTGGEAAFRGLDYQKKFIAYLALEMLLGKRPIVRISCEHQDDIEVEENDSILTYYQIKSTKRRTLAKSKIIEALNLFLSIQAMKKANRVNNYVLVSNADIGQITKESLTLYPLKKTSFESIITAKSEKEKQGFDLEKIFLMKGPHLEEISCIVTSMLVAALKDKYHYYNYISIREALLDYINRMCPGPIDLEDKTIIKESEIRYHFYHLLVCFSMFWFRFYRYGYFISIYLNFSR
jgi:hypothetical protein